ncbi:DUF4347 domain-containing protein, partial [Azospirillum isscasi]
MTMQSTDATSPLPPAVDATSTIVIGSATVDEAVRQEVLFISPTVQDYESLLSGVRAGVEVAVLDPDRDAMRQIADYLRGRTGVEVVHIISHGSAGRLVFGTGDLSAETLEGYRPELDAIRAALAPNGDIRLYGCNIGEGPAGIAFISSLATLTEADVAASVDLTGGGIDGNWDLEAQTGDIESGSVLTAEAEAAYEGVLSVASFSTSVRPSGFPSCMAGGSTRWVIGDFDNDGDMDILVQTSSIAGSAVSYLRNDGGGNYSVIAQPNGSAFTAGPFSGIYFSNLTNGNTYVSDYDYDGDYDIYEPLSRRYLENNNGSFSIGVKPSAFPSCITGGSTRWITADFDNDGDMDILVQAASIAGSAVSYLRNDGGGNYSVIDQPNGSAFTAGPFSGIYFSLLTNGNTYVGDYDGDGDLDLYEPLSRRYLENNNGSFSIGVKPSAFPSCITGGSTRWITADFDNDGDMDILVQAASIAGSAVSYLRNDGGGNYSVIDQPNGSAFTAGPFSGIYFSGNITNGNTYISDYDGDGDLDLYEPLTGRYLVQSGAAPVLNRITSTPGDGATNVSVSANLVFKFSEAVTVGTGSNNHIIIRNFATGAIVESIAANSSQVTGSGSDTVTINPTNDLLAGTQYYIELERGAFFDSDGHIVGQLEQNPIIQHGAIIGALTSKYYLDFTTGGGGSPAPTVTLSVSSASLAEAAGTATVTATLSAAAASDTTVTLTATGTATGGGTDYTLSSTSITILAGQTTGTATITAVQDTLDEADETIILDITGVSGGGGATESGTQQVTASITDDDPTPTLSIADVSQAEGDSGTSTMTFTVSLSAASGKTVTVDYATSNGTATSGSDYSATSGSLTFNPGDTSKTFTVTIAGDTTTESDETFTVTLSNASNATLGTATATGTISNDEISYPSVSSINRATPSASITNASTVTYQVTFNQSVTGVGTNDFTLTTSGLTGASVSSVSGSGSIYTVTVATGSGDGTLRLDVTDDDSILNGTSVALGGSGASNGNYTSGQTYTIDKTVPSLSIGTVSTDDRINDAEDESAVTIAGTTSGAEDGRVVSVTVGTVTQTATVSAGAWTTSLTSSQVKALSEGSVTITASVSDQAGNPATAATRTVSYDRTAPSLSIGTVSGDDRISDAEDESAVTIAGTASAEDGRVVSVTVGTVTQTATVSAGAWTT